MELKGSKTEKNLMEAFAGESQARNKYTYFASVAKKEMRGVAEVEARHEARYNALAKNVETGEVFVRTGKRRWECLNCGAVIISEKAPEMCPVCKHPRAYFALEPENAY